MDIEPIEDHKNSVHHFCFGHGVGAHVCGIAGISEARLEEMNMNEESKVSFVSGKTIEMRFFK